jgi:hypothetical protein
MWIVVDIVLTVAKDKLKFALNNIVKTLKEIFARGIKVQLCALDKATVGGKGKMFMLILEADIFIGFVWNKGTKIQILSVLVNKCEAQPCFVSSLLL